MSWRKNLFAVTAATFIGFTGFTLVMPFLPLYFQQLGVTDVGEIALWSGLSLGVTPAITALMAPLWGRLADRVGRKIMIERSLASFVIVMAAMGFVTEAVARLRAARRAGTLRRLRRAGTDDGGGCGAAGSDGVCDRDGADGAAYRAGARSGHRRHGRADRRPPARVSGHGRLLPGGARARVHDVSRAPRPRRRPTRRARGASRSATCWRSRTSFCSSRSCSACSSSTGASDRCFRSMSPSSERRWTRSRSSPVCCFRSPLVQARSGTTLPEVC